MSHPRWIIGRQPILDGSGAVCAYELLFCRPGEGQARVEDPTRATAEVILGALSGFGVEQILAGHRGFINVDRELLFHDALELIPREHIVLELLETIEPTAEVVERCARLREAGFALALDDHRFDPRFEPLYRMVEVVKVDLSLVPEGELPDLVERLRPWPVTLLAEKVETSRQFRRCQDLGFTCFQGYFFARPALVERRRLDEAATCLLRLLGLLQQEAEVREIEAAFRESPGLTYKLLVLVNSVAVGSRERIGTVRHAINLLGRRQMRRWVQLALFASDARAGADDPLLDMAAVRAGFLEQLALRHPALAASPEAPEQGFMTGILSLLDEVYAISMPELVRMLHLAEPVGAALLRREGVLGQLLTFVERMERLELDAAFDQLAALRIGRADALEAQWMAFAWRAAGRAAEPDPPLPPGTALA